MSEKEPEKEPEKEKMFDEQDVLGIGVTDQDEPFVLLRRDSEEVTYTLSPQTFRDLFPFVESRGSAWYLVSKNGHKSIQIDHTNERYLKAFGIDSSIVHRVINQHKSGSQMKAIKNAGFENEFCVLFGNAIVYHSQNKDEAVTFVAANSQHLALTLYEPGKI